MHHAFKKYLKYALSNKQLKMKNDQDPQYDPNSEFCDSLVTTILY